jgi:histidine triad (HIT) family protein
MEDCLFCSIAGGEKENLVWQNERAAAFKDIHPKAPTHVLVVTKKHYVNLNAVDDPLIVGQLILDAKEVAHMLGIGESFRLVINTGPHAGMIDHLHVHVMGGKPLDDYPRGHQDPAYPSKPPTD